MARKLERGLSRWAVTFVLAVVALLPLAVKNPYYLHLLVMVGLGIMLACSLDIMVGYAGQMSFAHAAFYGIGAYTSAILATRLSLPFPVCLVLAGTVAALAGLPVGFSSLRLRGPYLAITTIGFQEIVVIVLSQWVGLTRGPMGITGIPKARLLGLSIKTLTGQYYLLLGIGLVVALLILRMTSTRLGLQLKAIREDEIAARAMGVPVTELKLLAFGLSSFLAGIAGSFYSQYIGSVDPYTFQIGFSSTILVMVLAGGSGTMVGPAVGAVIMTLFPEIMRGYVGAALRMVIYGLLLIAVILFLPEGVVGAYRAWLKGPRNRRHQRTGSELTA